MLTGLDPLRLLHTTDDLERAVIVELHNRAIELKKKEREALANEIANEVVRRFSK